MSPELVGFVAWSFERRAILISDTVQPYAGLLQGPSFFSCLFPFDFMLPSGVVDALIIKQTFNFSVRDANMECADVLV